MLNIAIESPGVTGNYKLGEVTILLARLVAALRLTKVYEQWFRLYLPDKKKFARGFVYLRFYICVNVLHPDLNESRNVKSCSCHRSIRDFSKDSGVFKDPLHAIDFAFLSPESKLYKVLAIPKDPAVTDDNKESSSTRAEAKEASASGSFRQRQPPLQFTDERFNSNLKVWVGTWNQGEHPPPEDLEAWLPRSGYDVFSVGTQENHFDVTKDLSGDDSFGDAEHEWHVRLFAHFGKDYVFLGKRVLRYIMVHVFIRRDLVHLVSVSTEAVATGLGNVYGNKGGPVGCVSV